MSDLFPGGGAGSGGGGTPPPNPGPRYGATGQHAGASGVVTAPTTAVFVRSANAQVTDSGGGPSATAVTTLRYTDYHTSGFWKDDFIGGASPEFGDTRWVPFITGIGQITVLAPSFPGDAAHPGQLRLTTGSGSPGTASLAQDDFGRFHKADPWTQTWILKIETGAPINADAQVSLLHDTTLGRIQIIKPAGSLNWLFRIHDGVTEFTSVLGPMINGGWTRCVLESAGGVFQDTVTATVVTTGGTYTSQLTVPYAAVGLRPYAEINNLAVNQQHDLVLDYWDIMIHGLAR